jgi:hypothetical protein
VQTAFNSPPCSNYLPESPAHLSGVSTTTAINSPVAVDAAALAAAHGVPQPPARLKRSNVLSRLSHDPETGSKRIKRSQLVEDYLFAATGERVLLLVATSHPSFNSHWFCIYERQEKGRKPLIFGDILFFQIEAVVLKNAYRANFISGQYTQKEFGNLFSSRGGAALGLTFPGCPRSFEFELKSADVFFSCAMLQVWDTTMRSERRRCA